MPPKSAIRLDDLGPNALLEVTCKTCGTTRYESPRDLITKARLSGACLDEVEQALSCMARPQTLRRANRMPGTPAICRGPVELTLLESQPQDQLLRAVAGE
jgi:hypothetical protein